MNKQALLEDVYNSAFEDELEKISMKGFKVTASKLKGVLKSGKRKRLVESVKESLESKGGSINETFSDTTSPLVQKRVGQLVALLRR